MANFVSQLTPLTRPPHKLLMTLPWQIIRALCFKIHSINKLKMLCGLWKKVKYFQGLHFKLHIRDSQYI